MALQIFSSKGSPLKSSMPISLAGHLGQVLAQTQQPRLELVGSKLGLKFFANHSDVGADGGNQRDE